MDNSAIVDEAAQKRTQEYATLLSKSRLLRVLDGSLEFINDVGIEYDYDTLPLYQNIIEVIDVLAPERGQELERLAQEQYEQGTELGRLKAINTELAEMLDNVVERGLIYWEPQTERGAVAKAEMLEKASALIVKAQQVHQPARQSSIPEPEIDRDLEPDL